MTPDETTAARIVSAAAELFVAQGYGGTSVQDVARRAGVGTRSVRRLVGGKRELLDAVLAQRPVSPTAARVADAARSPDDVPPLSALIEAAHDLVVDPRGGWGTLELEILARAREDAELRAAAAGQVAERSANVRLVAASSREAKGVDPTLSDEALVHLSMALSIGLSMLDVVAEHPPTGEQWDAIIAKIGAAVAPDDLLLEPEFAVRTRWLLRVDVPDRAGAIAALMRAFAALHAKALYVQVVEVVADDHRTIDVGLATPLDISEAVVRASAESVGSHVYLRLVGPNEEVQDPLTLTLDGATHLVKHPHHAPQIAGALVSADDVEVIGATTGSDDDANVLRLQWAADRHVILRRHWAPFASTERARASAVLRLAAAVARLSGDDDAVGWIEPVAEGTVWIRLARPQDAELVAQMHERCSDRSRYQRYFSLTQWRDVRLRRLTGGHRGASLVVMSRDGQIIGLGNVFPESPDDPTTAEIALLVEDAYQGRGVGSVLLRRMLQVAEGMAFQRVVAHVLADNVGMVRMLERTGLAWASTVTDGVAEMVADLPAPDLPGGERPLSTGATRPEPTDPILDR